MKNEDTESAIRTEHKQPIGQVAGTAANTDPRETADVQLYELNEGLIIHTDEERGCDVKGEDVTKEMIPAKHFPLKEFPEVSQDTEGKGYNFFS